MANSPHYPEINGNPFDRGRAHGGELRQQVHACVDFYRSIFGYGEADLAARASVFEALIEAYTPSLAEEIRGIAAGAGLPPFHLFAINARSELVPFDVGECTALSFPTEGLLGQTWDWCQQLEDLLTVLLVSREDGHRLLTVTEPGIVGKIGLSSAGVGVGLNFISAPRTSDGVPVHILLREVLEADSLAAARQRLRDGGVGHSGNIMVGSDKGVAVNFEFSGDEFDESELQDHFCHTNHCLARTLSAGDMETNSLARLDRARDLLAGGDIAGIAGLKTILSDQQDAENPICAPYKLLFGLDVGTICTVITDLRERQLHLRMGSHPENAFRVFSLEGVN